MAEEKELYREISLGVWEPVPPDTPIEIMWKIACGKQ